MAEKRDEAFRTIGELAMELGVAQHVLRYWETRFPQLRPLQRAGNRRYYRPADVELARRIHRLLGAKGYTVKGVQKLLDGESEGAAAIPVAEPSPVADRVTGAELRAVRNGLAAALVDDAALAPR